MGYSREVYDAAMSELERRRTEARARRNARKNDSEESRIRELEQEMSGGGHGCEAF